MSRIAAAWKHLRAWIKGDRLRLGLALRVTVAGLLTLLIAQALQLPLGGLWAVLTAVIVTQMSVGGSLRATIEYMIGTLGGAVYAAVLALVFPRQNEAASFAVLALALAPLGFLAASNPNFRVAPFTAIIVLVGTNATHVTPFESALYRVFEVALGGFVAVVVSLVVVPARAQTLAIEAAAGALRLMAQELPKLLRGSTENMEISAILAIQDHIGRVVAAVEASIADARRERVMRLAAEPDLGPLSRTLLRLRHDLVIIGRAAVTPLPMEFQERLGPLIAAVGERASDYLERSGAALIARRAAPALGGPDSAFAHYAAEIAAIRRDGLTLALPGDVVERIFALGFALQQLHRDLIDLQRCVDELNDRPSAARPPGASPTLHDPGAETEQS